MWRTTDVMNVAKLLFNSRRGRRLSSSVCRAGKKTICLIIGLAMLCQWRGGRQKECILQTNTGPVGLKQRSAMPAIVNDLKLKSGYVQPSVSQVTSDDQCQSNSASQPMPVNQCQSTSANLPVPIYQCQSTSASLPVPVTQCQSTSASQPVPIYQCQSTSKLIITISSQFIYYTYNLTLILHVFIFTN